MCCLYCIAVIISVEMKRRRESQCDLGAEAPKLGFAVPQGIVICRPAELLSSPNATDRRAEALLCKLMAMCASFGPTHLCGGGEEGVAALSRDGFQEQTLK